MLMLAHQPLYGAAGNGNSLPVHLFPDLVGPIDLHVGVSHPLDLGLEFIIALCPIAACPKVPAKALP